MSEGQGETFSLQLQRPDQGVPWGFRLQGGVDFSTPLSVQVVQPNGVAERCGLRAGDAILRINTSATDTLLHEQAKMEIIRSGNDIQMLIQRGGVIIWKPQITPLSDLRPGERRIIQSATGDEIHATQKTSLAKQHQDEPLHIGSSHNRSARPFPGGGTPKEAIPNVVHSQYNTPIGLYSAENIVDTYSAQTDGIADDVQHLDLNEYNVGTKLTGTYQPMDQRGPEGPGYAPQGDVQDNAVAETVSQSDHVNTDIDTKDDYKENVIRNVNDTGNIPTNGHDSLNKLGFPTNTHAHQSRSFKLLQDDLDRNELEHGDTMNASPSSSGFRSVRAPEARPQDQQQKTTQQLMRCGECDMVVTGVAVKARGVPFHVQCFKCASCGVNLKQKGYFVIKDKLYCDIHAKRMAQDEAGSTMVATPVFR